MNMNRFLKEKKIAEQDIYNIECWTAHHILKVYLGLYTSYTELFNLYKTPPTKNINIMNHKTSIEI